jgi:hypothetical protein
MISVWTWEIEAARVIAHLFLHTVPFHINMADNQLFLSIPLTCVLEEQWSF